MHQSPQSLKLFLNKKVRQFNSPSFIKDDPISIPHQFSVKQDIEISALFAAVFAWGNRTTIINKCKELLQLMDNVPHQFILQHQESDLKNFLNFKHRTFNTIDLLYFMLFLKHHYSKHTSLESAFYLNQKTEKSSNVEQLLTTFHDYFFSLEDAPLRTGKHISTPQRNSACKRMNMYLRWMVRKDKSGVDFGLWKSIPMSNLICPLDVHVARVAKHFNLLQRSTADWKSALELTNNLRKLDPRDPVKYDFALFGLGAIEKFQ